MRKKRNSGPLATVRRIALIARDIYYQTTGLFALGAALLFLLCVPVAVLAHHKTPSAAGDAATGEIVRHVAEAAG
jgi:hypothetical protein